MMAETDPYEAAMQDATSAAYADVEDWILAEVDAHEDTIFGRGRDGLVREVGAESVVAMLYDRPRAIIRFNAVHQAEVPPAVLMAMRAMLARLAPGLEVAETDPAIIAFLRETRREFSGHVTATIRERLRTAVANALAERRGAEALRDAIRGVFRGFRGTHSLTAARTEINGGAQWARYQAILRTVPVLARDGRRPLVMWLTQRDVRVRDSHADVDGQVNEVGEPFVVGGCEMLYPMDAASCSDASEIVGCRCTLFAAPVAGALPLGFVLPSVPAVVPGAASWGASASDGIPDDGAPAGGSLPGAGVVAGLAAVVATLGSGASSPAAASTPTASGPAAETANEAANEVAAAFAEAEEAQAVATAAEEAAEAAEEALTVAEAAAEKAVTQAQAAMQAAMAAPPGTLAKAGLEAKALTLAKAASAAVSAAYQAAVLAELAAAKAVAAKESALALLALAGLLSLGEDEEE